MSDCYCDTTHLISSHTFHVQVGSCDEGVSYLVQKGADVGQLIAGNITVLHISAEHGLIEAVTSLLNTEMGRKCCGIQTNEGNLPVHLAAMAGHKLIVEILLPHTIGMNIDTSGLFYTSTTTVDEVMTDGASRMAAWEKRAVDDRAKVEALLNSERSAASSTSTFQVESTSPALTPEAEVESGDINLSISTMIYLFLSCRIVFLSFHDMSYIFLSRRIKSNFFLLRPIFFCRTLSCSIVFY